jgi:transcriptional regulator of molybdate metabolism, XRE family
LSIILDKEWNERRESMGFKVKEVRLAKNISQDELSKASGVSRQTISDLERGEVVNTTTATLAKLAEALGCKVGDIFAPDV